MDKKTYLEKELEVVRTSFEKEGKYFDEWYLEPLYPDDPDVMYILHVKSDWLRALENRVLADGEIIGRIYQLAFKIIHDIAYVNTIYYESDRKRSFNLMS